jgi:hypothetical protein
VSDRLGRFRHLEGPRAEREPSEAAAPSAHAGRFEGVERPAGGAPVAAPRTGARLERFGPDADPVLELVDTDGRRPFTRCLRCGMDSNVLATECPGCAARLDTEAQRAFDERFWAARQAEAAREAAAEAERRAIQERALAEDARARRALGETLAREVGAQERRRLDAAEGRPWGGLGGRTWGGGWSGAYDPTPLGVRLLRLLPPPWRVPAGALAAVAVVGLVGAGLLGVGGARGPLLGVGAFLALLLLAPPRRLSRWWW